MHSLIPIPTAAWRRMLLAAGAALLLLTACQSSHLKLTPARRDLARQLETIDPAQDALATSTSIIDIHTHTFNTRYLPLRGILRGKRDALPPVTTLISDDCAALIAQGLVDRTDLASIDGQPGVTRKPDTKNLRDEGDPGWICGVFLGLLDKAIESKAWEPEPDLELKMKTLNDIADQMSFSERLAVRAAVSMMGMEEPKKKVKDSDDTMGFLKSAVRFLWILTQSDADMTTLYRSLHSQAAMAGPITMVSHMMDLGPVYDQAPEGNDFLDFQTQQVKRMEHFQNAPGSGLLYFVAYNPYRDHWPQADSMKALEMVKDAITHHGAKGVKVYPPSGYRPAGNKIRPRPSAFFTRFPDKQWDARYGSLGPDKNNALDAKLNALLQWCMTNDVPVFTHSGYGEFEARQGYGEHHSNPVFWKQFLEAHSKPGKPCKLRLCLGHAGGEDFWIGTGTHADWGRIVYELCTTYPNVYCEVTSGEAMIDTGTQAFFVERMGALFAQSTNAPYSLGKKLIFGTDWPLPDQGKPASVLRATQKAFLHPSLRKHYADYFSANARRYLKIDAAPK